MLDPAVFKFACTSLHYRPGIDLFASKLHHQVNLYFSKAPDPDAYGRHALNHSWKTLPKPFANPPWHLIPLIIKKIRLEQIRLMLITPERPNSHGGPFCHPSLKNLSV